MSRFLTVCMAAAGLMLTAAGSASAAPKADAPKEKATCTAGVGKAVCCKAYVANHCSYVSCCEKGNAGFFTTSNCGTCAKHSAQAQASHQKSCASSSASACCAKASKSGYVASAEVGNRGFFSGSGCSVSAAKSGGTSSKGAC